MSNAAPNLAGRMRLVLIIQGIIAILAGIIMLVWPGPSVLVFVGLFAAWLIVDGLFSGIGWFFQDKRTRTVWGLVAGIVSVLAGIVVLFMPSAVALAIVILVAVWAIIIGIVQIFGAFGLRRMGVGLWWSLLISGGIAILFGILMLVNPAAGIISLLWMVAVVVIAEGIAAIVLGVKIGKLGTLP